MKSIKYLFVMVIMLSASCSKDDVSEINDTALYGSWDMITKYKEGDVISIYAQTFTFNPDLSGNIIGVMYDQNTPENKTVIVDENFTWSTKEDNLLIQPIKEDLIDELYSYVITKNTLIPDTLTIEDKHGVQRYYQVDGTDFQ